MVKAVWRLSMSGIFLLLAACGNSVSDVEYVQHAQDLLDKGELNSAAIELKNALQQNPKNPQARRMLGVVNFEVNDMSGAEKELRKARELGVADEAVLPLLARALLSQAKYEDLDALSLQHLSVGLAKAEVLSAQGLGKLAQRKPDEARKFIGQAVQMAADSPYVGAARAQLLAADGDYAAARKELNRVLAVDKKYALAWSLLGTLQKSQKKFAEAEESYTKAIEYRRAHTTDLLDRAMVRIQLNKYEAAQKDVDILLKRLPRHPGVNYAQGLIYLHTDKLEAAKNAFEASLRADDRQLPPKYYLALINLRLGNFEQADDYGERAFAAAPTSVEVRKVLAAIKLKKREFAQAEELVQPIVAARKDDADAMNLLASALFAQNMADKAVPLLQQLLSLQPDSAMIELRLGAALLAVGNVDDGVAHIEKSLEKDPEQSLARLLLVRHYVDQKQLDKAMQVANAYRDSKPDSPAPWNLIGSLFLKEGDEPAAVKAFDRARSLAPGDPEANFNLAALAAKANDFQKARGYYEDVLRQHKDHLDTLLKLAALDAVEKKEPQMVEHLKQAVSAHPKAARPSVMLARYYLIKGEVEKVAPLIVELNSQDKNSSSALEVLAMSQLAQKQYSEAKYNLGQLIERTPEVAQLHFLLATAYAGLKDMKAMEQELQKTVELAPNHIAAHLALARLALLQKRRDKAQEQVALLEKLAPKHSEVLYLQALLARSEGDQSDAKDLLEEVFAMAPNTQTMFSLAQQKWVMGDSEGALKIQEEWTKGHPDDLAALAALAGTYGQEGAQDKAIAQYMLVLQKDAKNVVALNGLAWNLRDSQPAKALEYAKKANELVPNSVPVLDTLAMVQLSNNHVKEAQRTIARALEKAPENPSLQYHSALIAFTAGDKFSAKEALETLLGRDADFPEKKEAQELLRKLRAE